MKLSRRTLVFVVVAFVLAFSLNVFAQQITLTMIAESRDTHLAWQQEMIARFEAENPHIKVELVSTAGTGLVDKMQTMLIGGSPLDIGYMDPWLIVEWAKEGVLEDLRPYIDRETEQFADWAPPFFDLYAMDGGVYALPQDIQLGAIFYDKDAYDSAGIGYPTPNWSYDDLFENGRNLTVYGSGGQVTRHGYRMPGGRNWMPTIWAFGGDFLDDWISPTRFTGNMPEVAAGMQYLADLVQHGIAQDRQTNGSMTVNDAFLNRRASMIMSNTILFGHLIDVAEFSWDVAPLPHGPGGYVPQVNAIGWMLFESSRHKEEAWKLLQFMTTEDALIRRVEIVGNVSPNLAVTQNVWLPSFKEPEHRHLLLSGIENSRSAWPIDRTIWTVIDREVSGVFWGEKPVANALSEMERLVNARLNDMK